MRPNCPTYKQKLEELKTLHNQFQEELEVFKSSRDSGNVWETRKKIEEIVRYFEEGELFGVDSEVREISNKFFTAEKYSERIAIDNQAPESFIWNGRRILRSTIQIIIKKLKETGQVEDKVDGYKAQYAGNMQELKTKNPIFKEFVDALNIVIYQYPELYKGSEEIYNSFSGKSGWGKKKTEASEKEGQEIARDFVDEDYIKEIIEDDLAPESFIWNGRRILRTVVQIINRNLKKTGQVREKSGGYDSQKAGGMCELETDNPIFEKFVHAMNIVIKDYDKLFNGSEKIWRDWKNFEPRK